MSIYGKSLISPDDFTVEELQTVVNTAREMMDDCLSRSMQRQDISYTVL